MPKPAQKVLLAFLALAAATLALGLFAMRQGPSRSLTVTNESPSIRTNVAGTNSIPR
jgi:hypothetical protein